MTKTKLVSIIIPAFNEEKNIDKCLRSIKKLDIPKDQYEVIVVDNGSTDKTVEIAESFGAQVFTKPKINISSLRNFGTSIARGDIFAFIDADCVLDRYWLTEALKELEIEEIGATGSNCRLKGNGTWISKAWEFNKRSKLQRCDVDWIQSANLIIKRKCFEDVGGFDDRLSVCEDSDICYRIKDKGYTIISNPAICSYHLRFTETLGSFFKNELWHGKDVLKLFFISKNKKMYIKILGLTVFFLINLSVIFISILSLNLKLAIFAVIAMVLLSLILAIIKSFETKDYRYVMPLSALFLTFGIARAVCLVDVRNWRK